MPEDAGAGRLGRRLCYRVSGAGKFYSMFLHEFARTRNRVFEPHSCSLEQLLLLQTGLSAKRNLSTRVAWGFPRLLPLLG